MHNALCETCRVLMSRGITGSFETLKEGILYPCTTGDTASTAKLTVHEPDDGVEHFTRWRPFDQNAVSALRSRRQRARAVCERLRVLAREGSNWPMLRNGARMNPNLRVSSLIDA